MHDQKIGLCVEVENLVSGRGDEIFPGRDRTKGKDMKREEIGRLGWCGGSICTAEEDKTRQDKTRQDKTRQDRQEDR